MDWVNKCNEPDKLRLGMMNAWRLNKMAEHKLMFIRLNKLINKDPDNQIEQEFYYMLEVYEQLLTNKYKRKTIAIRTRKMLKTKSVMQCMEYWAKLNAKTNGFKLLNECGFADLTIESIIQRHSNAFSIHLVDKTYFRLLTSINHTSCTLK
ncbi:hypothetical protein MTBLM5_210002 [Magnetospirillum sp. LM-5]|uniref:hypothetical protein n=1 Tax=Magnetospirillum sp. LM-5 TaxID=2681466 RepID=UPI001382BFAA|nr:hypothetical protein [Magnetospirillum sp. LM-5]CAA7617387.1 hypothetical protein MTBLM5_210002 [Magnetospirillum sp. LM-5]